MSILAIDTAGETASAAVTGRDGNIYEKMNHDSMDHLKSLMLLTGGVMKEHGTGLKDLEYIAVSAGPGSFTGIRIGMAAAKTMAQVLGIPVAPVMTLDAYACNDYGMEEPFLLCPMIDARRSNVYAAVYEMPERRKIVREDCYALRDLLDQIPGGRKVVFAGSGASAHRDELGNGIVAGTGLSASAVLRCAEEQKHLVSCYEAEPVYLRQAEAEVKRREGKLGLRARKKKKERETPAALPPADEKITYRTVSLEDVPALAELDAACFSSSWSTEAFEGDLNGSRPAVYEAAFNSTGKMIGFAGAVFLDGEAEVNRVAVHPLYRRRGIAGKCMEAVLSGLREQGVSRAVLEVREANRSAITLYKNCGFRVISKRRNYYRKTGENALIMQLDTEGTDEGR